MYRRYIVPSIRTPGHPPDDGRGYIVLTRLTRPAGRIWERSVPLVQIRCACRLAQLRTEASTRRQDYRRRRRRRVHAGQPQVPRTSAIERGNRVGENATAPPGTIHGIT